MVEVTRARIAALGGSLTTTLVCDHDEAAVAAALAQMQDVGCDIVLVLGASAIVDRRDVVPAAIEQAGGTVEHFGMPVDPGNLMLLARLGAMRVLGLPGSARSARLHGFDWVLQRLHAGLDVTGADLMHMGVGGLLKEIPTRPLPRAAAAPLVEPRRRGRDPARRRAGAGRRPVAAHGPAQQAARRGRRHADGAPRRVGADSLARAADHRRDRPRGGAACRPRSTACRSPSSTIPTTPRA